MWVVIYLFLGLNWNKGKIKLNGALDEAELKMGFTIVKFFVGNILNWGIKMNKDFKENWAKIRIK